MFLWSPPAATWPHAATGAPPPAPYKPAQYLPRFFSLLTPWTSIERVVVRNTAAGLKSSNQESDYLE
ncbi:hypothetical protein AAMO2058_000251500 [Amorphochlora amoebiformis]